MATLRVQPEAQAKTSVLRENLLRSYFPKKISELDAFLKGPALNEGNLSNLKAPLDIPVPDPVKEKEKEEQKKQQEKEDKDDKKKGEVEDKGPPCGPMNCNEKITVLLQCLKPEIKDVTEQLNLLPHSNLHFSERGDAVTKAAKQPHVGDYWQQVQELDEAEYQDIQLMVMEIHSAYAVLYDIILKNLDKLKKPRGETKGVIY
uniref:Proteasome activator complex subunit 1 n=1 Tax=Aotus nancymaae TaxID=37293 RepID=A0A2K5D5B3_AOTNA